MEDYVTLFLSEQMIGNQGLLKGQGLIPLPQKMREEVRARFEQRGELKLADLK